MIAGFLAHYGPGLMTAGFTFLAILNVHILLCLLNNGKMSKMARSHLHFYNKWQARLKAFYFVLFFLLFIGASVYGLVYGHLWLALAGVTYGIIRLMVFMCMRRSDGSYDRGDRRYDRRRPI